MDTSVTDAFLVRTMAGVSAAFTGWGMLAFWQPEQLKRYGVVVMFSMITGITAASGVAFFGVTAMWLGLPRDSVDIALSLGAVIGIISVFVINSIANFARKREGNDIVEVASEVKGAILKHTVPTKRPAKKVPVKQVVAKKAVRKTPVKKATK